MNIYKVEREDGALRTGFVTFDIDLNELMNVDSLG